MKVFGERIATQPVYRLDLEKKNELVYVKPLWYITNSDRERMETKIFCKEVEFLIRKALKNWSFQSAHLVINGAQYQIGTDTKLVSKILEISIVTCIVQALTKQGIKTQINQCQTKYPDLVIFTGDGTPVALDVKTSYRKTKHSVAGFTLGTFKGYFRSAVAPRAALYPYSQFAKHFVTCVIYDRVGSTTIENVDAFLREKWEIASKVPGSGNTTNIGSVKNIKCLLQRKTIFASDKEFFSYWSTYKSSKPLRGAERPQ